MPVYTYCCQKCGAQFDTSQHFDDRPLTRCPECRNGKVHRLVQASAIIFKGSGWYSTDHRSVSGQGASRHDESGSAKIESIPGKADGQPAGKELESKKLDVVSEQAEGRRRARGAYPRMARYNQPKRPVA